MWGWLALVGLGRVYHSAHQGADVSTRALGPELSWDGALVPKPRLLLNEALAWHPEKPGEGPAALLLFVRVETMEQSSIQEGLRDC